MALLTIYNEVGGREVFDNDWDGITKDWYNAMSLAGQRPTFKQTDAVDVAVKALKAAMSSVPGPQGPPGQDGADGQDAQDPVFTVATGPAGSQVTIAGTYPNLTLTIPAGIAGQNAQNPNFSVQTGAAGSQVTISGTYPDLTISIPAGQTGAQGSAGLRGTQWFTGSASPSGGIVGLGNNDFYAKYDGSVWQYSAATATWYNLFSIVGPTGPAGQSAAIYNSIGGNTDGAMTQAATTAALATKADLVNGLVPAAQLPSFVDDVLEYATFSALPLTGEAGKIYVTTTGTDANKQWRWAGSLYVQIVASPGTTDEITEGVNNLFFTNARANAAVTPAGSNGAIQYNNSGTRGGFGNYNVTTSTLTLPGALVTGGNISLPNGATININSRTILGASGDATYMYLDAGGLSVKNAAGTSTLFNFTSAGGLLLASTLSTNGSVIASNTVSAPVGTFSTSVSGGDLYVSAATAPSVFWGASVNLSRRGPGILSLGNGNRDNSSGTLLLDTIGFGTGSPLEKIDVRGNIVLGNQTINAPRFVGIGSGTSGAFGGNSGFSGVEFGSPQGTNSGYIAFHYHRYGSFSGEGMRLNKWGQLGIGTNNPAYKLDVNGTARVVGDALFESGVQITAGAAAGKALVSDSNGNASWGNASLREVQFVSGNDNVDFAQERLVVVDASSGNISINTGEGSPAQAGTLVTFYRRDYSTNTVSISGVNLDGLTLASGQTLVYGKDVNNDWRVLSQNTNGGTEIPLSGTAQIDLSAFVADDCAMLEIFYKDTGDFVAGSITVMVRQLSATPRVDVIGTPNFGPSLNDIQVYDNGASPVVIVEPVLNSGNPASGKMRLTIL